MPKCPKCGRGIDSLSCECVGGYVNQETHTVAVLWGSDQAMYDLWLSEAHRYLRRAHQPHCLNPVAVAKANLVTAMETWATENRPELPVGPIYSDLLGDALTQVYWYEVAEDFLQIAQEERAAEQTA